MEKKYVVYKFTNTVTGDFYIGSQSIKIRYTNRKYQSVWIVINDQLDQDIQKYGLDNFEFEVLAEAEPERLKEVEQEFIEALKPTYNQMNDEDLDIESYKEYKSEYNKCKKSQKKYNNQLCCYNGETLTLGALSMRFRRAGIDHPFIEAKKYLLEQSI